MNEIMFTMLGFVCGILAGYSLFTHLLKKDLARIDHKIKRLVIEQQILSSIKESLKEIK